MRADVVPEEWGLAGRRQVGSEEEQQHNQVLTKLVGGRPQLVGRCSAGDFDCGRDGHWPVRCAGDGWRHGWTRGGRPTRSRPSTGRLVCASGLGRSFAVTNVWDSIGSK